VDFRYTEEQEALRDTLQRFIARDYGFERRRELARSSLGFSEHAWQTYAELGLLALPFPKDLGGLEGDGVDVMLVMEQVGRGLLLEPYLSTVVLCGGLIRDAAPAAMRAAIVPEIASGKLKLALGAYEPQGRYDLHRILSSAARSGSGWRISGRKSVALDAPSADYFVISARTQPATGEPLQDLALFLVPREARGVSLLAYPTQSGGRAADIALADVYVDESALIAPAGLAHAILERAVDRAAAALCAEAVGIAGMLNQTTLNSARRSALSKRCSIAWRTCTSPRNRCAPWPSPPPCNPARTMRSDGTAPSPEPRPTSARPPDWLASRRFRCTAQWAWSKTAS
jgi:alkylation response protein AidB-like acyl-CoA dehydrogenase